MVIIKYHEVRLPCSQETILLCCKGDENKLSGTDGDLKSPFDPSAQTPISFDGSLLWRSVGTVNSENTYSFKLDPPFDWHGDVELEEDPFPRIDDCLFFMAAEEDLGERMEEKHGNNLRLVEDDDA